MSKHVCNCQNCDPGMAPSGEREGPHHIGVRFNTHSDPDGGKHVWVIKLDGTVVPEVIEAVAGPTGRIFRFVPTTALDADDYPENVSDRPNAAHLCKNCRAGACAEWLFGKVEIERDGEPLVAPEEKVHA